MPLPYLPYCRMCGEPKPQPVEWEKHEAADLRARLERIHILAVQHYPSINPDIIDLSDVSKVY